MTLSERIRDKISEYHLLNHPFYQAWNRGELSLDVLKDYATQYYHHVDAFPRYISATHSQCQSQEKRKILLENLNDEEGTQYEPHIRLWLNFCVGLGLKENDVKSSQAKPAIKKTIKTFMGFARTSYAEGLASLYAYEYQVPEVAETKIEGLKEFYNFTEKKELSFFEVHKSADVHHRKQCEELLDNLSEEEGEKAMQAAQNSARSLWSFLTDVYEQRKVA